MSVSFAPFHASAALPHCRVACITENDVDDLVQLVRENVFKYYRDGINNEAWMRRRVVPLIERCKNGIPFTGFAVRDFSGKLLGFFILGFDDDPKKLQIAFAYTQQAEKRGVGKEVLNWALHRYVPALQARGMMDKTAIVAQEHPDFEACQWLRAAGFKLRETKVITEYAGPHNDGRRNVYEIAVDTLLKKAA